MTFVPNWRMASTAKTGESQQKSATPPWCWIGDGVANTHNWYYMYGEQFQGNVYVSLIEIGPRMGTTLCCGRGR